MDKENGGILVSGGGRARDSEEEYGVRVTRAMARVWGGLSAPSRHGFTKEQQKRKTKTKGERVALPNGVAPPNGNRLLLRDVSNISRQSHDMCAQKSKVQTKGVYKKTNRKVACDVSIQVLSTQGDLSTITKTKQSHETIVAEMLEDRELVQPCMSSGMTRQVMAGPLLSMHGSVKSNEHLCSLNEDINVISEKLKPSDGLGIVDIDSLELKDPLVWSLYAADIYNNLRAREFEKRPLNNYMQLQQDINPSMRGILIDWLVEVSEEYKLVPDTLYLTVNLIDRFLSQSMIQKQRLQLLGVSCMRIASKYEEIRAPPVEEFCFITDNTYTKAEVLKMENEILNLLHFRLSVPTTKTFLRRFILAAQSSYKVSYVELEFLANYLAELTLVEYSFLMFRPSLIAASAVLLAGWTLNQSEHPWNSTMEYYTNYKVSELKTTVLALADLQLNTKSCYLNAIREKYKQQKFKGVANLSPKPVQTFFQAQV